MFVYSRLFRWKYALRVGNVNAVVVFRRRAIMATAVTPMTATAMTRLWTNRRYSVETNPRNIDEQQNKNNKQNKIEQDNEIEQREKEEKEEEEEEKDSVTRQWRALAPHALLLANLRRQPGIATPTDIQQKTIPTLLQGRPAVICAETGSGKTLCYLIPILNRILSEEAEGTGGGEAEKSCHIILVPSVELASQIRQVVVWLSKDSLVTSFVNGVDRPADLLLMQRNDQECRLFVGTPASFLPYDFSKWRQTVKTLVLDEADMLLSQSFLRGVTELLGKLGLQVKRATKRSSQTPLSLDESRPSPQIICVAATLPNVGKQSIRSTIGELFPQCEVIYSERSHRTAKQLKQSFVRMLPEDRDGYLVQLLRDRYAENPALRTLVFVLGSSDAVNGVASTLKRAKLRVDALSSTGKPKRERAQDMERYLRGDFSVLVSSDLGARGFDLPDVDLVVQYDFALDTAGYLHRVGRTARGSVKRGEVVSFVCPHNEDLAKAIESAVSNNNDNDLESLLSERRLFRRRLKQQQQQQQEQQS